MPVKRIVVADAQPLVREALTQIINQVLPYSEVLPSQNANEVMHIIKNHSVSLLILDVNLIESDGFDLVRRAKAFGYRGKILFLSSSQHPMFTEMAQRLDVDGYIEKSEPTNIIREGIVNVMHGYTVFKRCSNSHKPIQLSKRETVVFNYLVNGHSNKDIAAMLCLSSKTVSTYKSRILKKHNVRSIIELVNTFGQLNDVSHSIADR
ncbi:response regulator transcription factor [Vibrio sonorensis]|uniref:response regulator transcription factor n=1 Tax=Vibrio sonorensis TaxID=1004316 RepID=UPI0008DAB3C1|nr:response regulator transcription factor [Vibrio sonorensis]